MRKTFTLLFSISITSLMSQSFTAYELMDIGDSMRMVTILDSNFTAPSSGNSQTWDYSKLIKSSVFSSLKYIDPKDAPNGSKFSGSNLCEVRTAPGFGGGQGKVYTYFYRTGNKLEQIGTEATQQVVPYTNKGTWYNFPVSYNSNANSSDDFGGTYKVAIVTIDRSGTITSYGRGSGKLMLPGGVSFDQTVLVELNISQKDSSNVFNQVTIINTEIKSWIWYVPSRRGPVFTVTETTGGFGGQNQTVRTLSMFDTGAVNAVNTEVATNSLSIFPNPAKQEVMIISDAGVKDSYYTISDLSGRIYIQNRLSPNNGFTKVDISSLSTGIYIIQCNGVTQKLLVQE